MQTTTELSAKRLERSGSELLPYLEELQNAISKRVRLNYPEAPGTPKEKTETEFEVHLAVRSLRTNYIDADMIGEGDLGATVRKRVRAALEKAVQCVSTDPKAVSSVRGCLQDFDKFVKRHGFPM